MGIPPSHHLRRLRSLLTVFSIAFVLVLICLPAVGCLPTTKQLPSQKVNPQPTPSTEKNRSTNWHNIYFTINCQSGELEHQDCPDKTLAEAINQARVSLDAAFYSFNLWGLQHAILDAQRRGIAIRLVIESDNIKEPEVKELVEAGIPVIQDHRESLMHNKFFVIDRQDVWTGSANPTLGSYYHDDNNLIQIRSPRLAENYTSEFEEMFEQNAFGIGSPANTPHPRFSENGTVLEAYFSPEDGVAHRIVELIHSAQDSIHFLAFVFTSDEIADAMIERAHAGVEVAGVMDGSQYRSNTGTEYDRLRSAGIDVRLDGNPENMHHKVIIIDERIVITGSYNLSASAESQNDENVLIIHNPHIALQYMQEFVRLYEEGVQ